ncbi:MAG TPA: rod shape-determining protein RodA [Chthonomonadales bacterium]|nr:rod shape-determining protein RodA [Chthonomonadales bacterium]
MLDHRLRKNLDLPLLLVALALLAIGIATLYSATRGADAVTLQKHIAFGAVGLALMVGATSVDCAKLARWVRTLYLAAIALLVLVLHVGAESHGAQRWIPLFGWQFQPSEFAKIAAIVGLAAYLQNRRDRVGQPAVLLLSLAYVGVPTILIFLQPNLGTTLVLVAIWLSMTFVAGARVTHLAAVVVAGLVLFAVAWNAGIIKPYQKERMVAFVYPSRDPADAGYHVRQSRIAIGSGQLWGKGYMRGTQVQGQFIPEKHTDFVFAVIGEEGGFVASALTVALFAGLLLRGLLAAARAGDGLSQLVAAGIVGMWSFHVMVNIGMTLGVMPVAGVPLPFVSYGGSSLIVNMVALGLLLSIGMRRHKLVF